MDGFGSEEKLGFESKIISSSCSVEEDVENEFTESQFDIRPKTLDEYIGQEKIKENLRIFIDAAKKRGESLDHVLIYGPEGCGKKTLASIIANEIGAEIKEVQGVFTQKPGEVAALLTNLSDKSILSINEIEEMNGEKEEILLSALDNRCVNVKIGKGNSAIQITLPLNDFTLIGTTDKYTAVSKLLRERFGVILRLDCYSDEEIAAIVKRSAKIIGVEITDEGAAMIALYSAGNPGKANKYLIRTRDYAEVKGNGIIDREIAQYALGKLVIDDLEKTDEKPKRRK